MTIALIELPSELLEQISGWIWDDRLSLITLGLTHSCFLEVTRRHLFARLSLSTCKVNKLYKLSNAHSFTFIPAIRDLKLVGGAPVDSSPCPTEAENRLLDFIQLLHPNQIKTLHLVDYTWSESGPARALDPSTVNIFGSITVLSLEAMNFEGFSVFTRLLAPFSLLRKLALNNLAWGQPSPGTHARFTAQLEQLSLRQCYVRDVLSWMLEQGKPLKLQNLDLGMIRESDTPAIGQFLSSTSSTLKHLRFGFDGLCSGGDAEAFSTYVNLGQYTHLQSLYIDNFVTNSYTFEDAYPYILKLLPTITAPLTTFSFSADLRDSLSFSLHDRLMDWDAFDDILNKSPFEKLEKLSILVLHTGDTSVVDDFEAQVQKRLTNMGPKAILECRGFMLIEDT